MAHYRMKAACSSPTPRTDKAAFWTKNAAGDPQQEVVDSEMARKLEIEVLSLSALIRDLERALVKKST